ncbi:unnamed protein product [Enterobius vermicularis]|uniref:Importin-11 n=1 Tax=Enterobius vermicularis TaxID=51028 RepID=A0A158QA91_ENTVE|nr:unnamed protein product [Enterobius vermicularis]
MAEHALEMTFNIWYRLSEFLYDRNDDSLSEKFRPFIERYLLALYRHCQLDPDEKDVPDYEGEHEYRLKIADSIKDVVFIVGTDNCVSNMITILHSCAMGTWVESEAALYIISVVIHNVLPTEETVVPSLVRAVLELSPDSHPALFHTAIRLFGNLVDWLDENKAYRDECIDWLLNKAQSEIYVRVAAESLETIFDKCGASLTKYFERLLALIPVLQKTTSKGQQVEASILSLLKASASLLNGLPPEEMASCLKVITDPQTDRLALATKDTLPNGSSPSSQTNNENCSDAWVQLTNDPVLWIDRIAAIFRQLQPWQSQPAKSTSPNNNVAPVPFLDTVNKVWPVLSMALNKFEDNTRVVEHLCRTIRFLIRSLGVQSIIFVDPLVHQMIDIYNRHQHSCFLYLASILVDEYGQLEHYRQGLVLMLQALSEESFKLLLRSNNFREHPDTIDDLYRLGIRFVHRAASVFFILPVCERLFECGISALDVDHVEANRSVTKFFIESVDSILIARKANYRDKGVEGAESLLDKYGERLVSGCLRASIFSVTGSLRRDMAEVIFMIGKMSKEKLSEWLNSALGTLPRDVGLAATTQQLQGFHRNVLELAM